MNSNFDSLYKHIAYVITGGCEYTFISQGHNHVISINGMIYKICKVQPYLKTNHSNFKLTVNCDNKFDNVISLSKHVIATLGLKMEQFYILLSQTCLEISGGTATIAIMSSHGGFKDLLGDNNKLIKLEYVNTNIS